MSADQPGEVVRVDQGVRPGEHGVDPLGRGAQRDAGHPQPVGLLLQAAGVGHDALCARRRARASRGSRPARSGAAAARARCRARRAPCAYAGGPGRRTTQPVAFRASTMPAQPLGLGVRLAVDRQHAYGSSHHRARRSRDRREEPRRVGHHVAHHLGSPGTPSAASCRASARPGRRAACAIRSISIRFRSSGIERSPLRRPASTCASGTSAADGRERARQGRVRVAVDEHPVRRAPRAAARRSPPASRPCRRCAGRVRSAAPRAPAPRRRPARARGRSAGPCAARSRRSRARGGRPTWAPP